MRVVLDTNVVASALLWGGTPERLIEAAGEGSLECFTSEALIAELAGILGRAKLAAKLLQKNLLAAEFVARYREIAETIKAAPVEEARLRDPNDAAVLACALAAQADAIVSGGDDLRTLGNYQGIPVLSPADCLNRIATGLSPSTSSCFSRRAENIRSRNPRPDILCKMQALRKWPTGGRR
ncbi:MAG: putative toxin-antitoxin system toxin component, PIN family [Burkholderiales bacterium]